MPITSVNPNWFRNQPTFFLCIFMLRAFVKIYCSNLLQLQYFLIYLNENCNTFLLQSFFYFWDDILFFSKSQKTKAVERTFQLLTFVMDIGKFTCPNHQSVMHHLWHPKASTHFWMSIMAFAECALCIEYCIIDLYSFFHDCWPI